MRLSRRHLALVVAAGAMILAGCSPSLEVAREADALRCPEGSDCFDAPTPIGPGGSMTVRIPDFSFEIVEDNAVDGPVEVTLVNDHNTLHNFRIDEAAGEAKKVEAAGGATETGTLQLFAGTYTFYCDIAGHRAAGMEGTLTVLEPDAVPTGAPTATPTESGTGAAPDPADGVDANNLDQDAVAALDDSDDIAGALADRGVARAYDVTFASGSTELAPGASGVLDQIEAILASDENIRLRIEGNTDSTGEAPDNLELSQQRAQAVVDALVTRGVDASRLEAVGNGETNLLVENDQDNDLAKQVNRRVEIHLVAS